jgi:hypothetical protein
MRPVAVVPDRGPRSTDSSPGNPSSRAVWLVELAATATRSPPEMLADGMHAATSKFQTRHALIYLVMHVDEYDRR